MVKSSLQKNQHQFVVILSFLCAFLALELPDVLVAADDVATMVHFSDIDPIDKSLQAEFTDLSQAFMPAGTDEVVTEESQPTKTGRYGVPGPHRAGWPQCIGRWARPAVCADYEVGYVGGGSLFFGKSRCRHEGTFGLDYSGWLISRKTWLKWTHGVRFQGGAGAYASDGPKLFE